MSNLDMAPGRVAGGTTVWMPRLDLFYLPELLRLFLRHGRLSLFIMSGTVQKDGLLRALIKLGVAAPGSQVLVNRGFGWRLDSPQSLLMEAPRHLREFDEEYMRNKSEAIRQLVDTVQGINRGRLTASIRAEVAMRIEALMYLTETVRQWVRGRPGVEHIYVLSPDCALLGERTPTWVKPGLRCQAVWDPRMSTLAHLALILWLFVKNLLAPRRTKLPPLPGIGVTYPSLMDVGPGRGDPLHWWKSSGLPADRVCIIFERADLPCTPELLETIERDGFRAVVMKRSALGNCSKDWLVRPVRLPLYETLRRLVVRTKIWWWAFGDRWRKSVAGILLHMLYAAERGSDLMRLHGLRALIHYDMVGADWAACACDLADAVRFREMRSTLHWPTLTAHRTEQVALMWGERDVEAHRATGDYNDAVLLTGCIVRGAGRHDCRSNAPARVLRDELLRSGSQRVLALFDTTLPSQTFFNFFVRQLKKDKRWGLLVKPKNNEDFWLGLSCYPRLIAAVKDFVKAGRIRVLDQALTPSEIGCAADVSVAWGINTAAVVNYIAGHRTVQIDLLNMAASSVGDWAFFYRHGRDQLVFNRFTDFWRALNLFYDNPANSQFGQASPRAVDALDHFQDGRGSERLGEIFRWFLEGLDRGMSWRAALADLQVRYQFKWGPRAVPKLLKEV